MQVLFHNDLRGRITGVNEPDPEPAPPRRTGLRHACRLVFEQQVSPSSGRAAFARLSAVCGRVEPGRGSDQERSTQPRWAREPRRPWSKGHAPHGGWDRAIPANAYLLFALRRADVRPTNDLVLAAAVQHIKRLGARPSGPDLEVGAPEWRPYRHAAARLLWHAYLAGVRPRPKSIDKHRDRGSSRVLEAARVESRGKPVWRAMFGSSGTAAARIAVPVG